MELVGDGGFLYNKKTPHRETTKLPMNHSTLFKQSEHNSSPQAGPGRLRHNEEFATQTKAGDRRKAAFSFMFLFQWILRGAGYVLAILALVASAGLLVGDVGIGNLSRLSPAVASAAPLLLVGTSFLFVQPLLRPRLLDLLKNLILAGTFLLWGIVQLMPQNTLSIRLGNLVIALYVLDLAWITLGTAISPRKNET
jgi:hypothetical protein